MKRKPTNVPDDFQPGARVLELAEEKGIPFDFVRGQISEFRFYWNERGVRRADWQRSFWNWVKKGWEWKQEKQRKQVRTNPSAHKDYQCEKIDTSDPEKVKKYREAMLQFKAV